MNIKLFHWEEKLHITKSDTNPSYMGSQTGVCRWPLYPVDLLEEDNQWQWAMLISTYNFMMSQLTSGALSLVTLCLRGLGGGLGCCRCCAHRGLLCVMDSSSSSLSSSLEGEWERKIQAVREQPSSSEQVTSPQHANHCSTCIPHLAC